MRCDDERTLAEAMRRAFHRAPELAPTPEFAVRLREALRDGPASRPLSRPERVLPNWLALAASLALICAGLFSVYQWPFGETLLAAAVGDHRNCALHFRLKEPPVPLAVAALDDAAYGVFEAVPGASVRLETGEALVRERHACVYGGHRWAHLVLRYRGARVSLVATRSGAVAPPATARVDGMNVAAFQSGVHTVFIVGDLPLPDLEALATAIARQLRGA